MRRLAGKVAIVTGAASDIGAATVQLLAREGASVVAADLDLAGADHVVAEVRKAGFEAVARRTNIADEESVRALIASAIDAFGGLDLLDNVAAYTESATVNADDDIVNMDTTVWNDIFAVNLRGTMLCCKHAIPEMLKRSGGSIVNISSTAAFLTLGTVPAYGASKAGMHSLTQAIATQYGPKRIRCNTVAPGLTLTKKTRALGEEFLRSALDNNVLPFLGEAHDIAQATLFLLSDEARYITGQLLAVDGGQTIHLPMYADMKRMARGEPLVKSTHG